MDPVTAPAIPDGLRLSKWIESRGLCRSTAYRLLRLAEIEPEIGKVEGSRKPACFLTAVQLQVMDAMVKHLCDGLSIAEVTAMVQAGEILPNPVEDLSPSLAPALGDRSPSDLGAVHTLSLTERLQAIRLALDTGAPLSTADVTVLLGARLGGEAVTRGRITARHRGSNVWTLEPSQDG
jgi:hypothetical protein